MRGFAEPRSRSWGLDEQWNQRKSGQGQKDPVGARPLASADAAGALTMPMTGPTTATSPIRSSLPNTSCHPSHASTAKLTPVSARRPRSTLNHGVAADSALNADAATRASTSSRRDGSTSRPTSHEARTNPPSCAVETSEARRG